MLPRRYVTPALCCQGSVLLRLYAESVQCCPSLMLPTRLYVAPVPCWHGIMFPRLCVAPVLYNRSSLLLQLFVVSALCFPGSFALQLCYVIDFFFFTEVYSFVCVCVCLYLSIYLALNKHVKKFVDFSRIQTEVILQNLLPDTCG